MSFLFRHTCLIKIGSLARVTFPYPTPICGLETFHVPLFIAATSSFCILLLYTICVQGHCVLATMSLLHTQIALSVRFSMLRLLWPLLLNHSSTSVHFHFSIRLELMLSLKQNQFSLSDVTILSQTSNEILGMFGHIETKAKGLSKNFKEFPGDRFQGNLRKLTVWGVLQILLIFTLAVEWPRSSRKKKEFKIF